MEDRTLRLHVVAAGGKPPAVALRAWDELSQYIADALMPEPRCGICGVHVHVCGGTHGDFLWRGEGE